MSVKATLQKSVTKRNAELAKRNKELDDIKARVEALEKLNETSNDEKELEKASEELDELKAKKAELEAEKAELEAEIEELNAQIEELDKPADDKPQRNKLGFMTKESRGVNKMTIEERNKQAENFVNTRKMVVDTEETRAVLVSSGNIATPTEVSGINENGFAGVSSIVDLVTVVNCEGMGKNRVTYVDADAEAAAHTEGAAAGGTGTTFGFVDIVPESVAVIDGISKQAKKQTPLQYQAKVRDKALLALRKYASKHIITKVLASKLLQTVTITALDQNSVRDIALNYGGDEGIEGTAYLILCKADLVALGKVRGTQEKKAVFEIIPDANPNTGTIKDGGTIIKYCLNKNLTAGTLLYGNPKNIELDLFSNYEVAVSEDFQFDKLMDTVRGDAELGAELVAKHGMVKVTVGADA